MVRELQADIFLRSQQPFRHCGPIQDVALTVVNFVLPHADALAILVEQWSKHLDTRKRAADKQLPVQICCTLHCATCVLCCP